jgi:hypothetical protein
MIHHLLTIVVVLLLLKSSGKFVGFLWLGLCYSCCFDLGVFVVLVVVVIVFVVVVVVFTSIFCLSSYTPETKNEKKINLCK